MASSPVVLNSRYPDRIEDPWYRRGLSEVQAVVRHHIGNLSFGPVLSDELGMLDSIYRYHTVSHGWPGIGYHMAIGQKKFYLVGSLDTVRAGVEGRNWNSLHALFLGDFTNAGPTQSMWNQYEVALDWIGNILPIEPVLTTHKAYALPSSPTSCPGESGISPDPDEEEDTELTPEQVQKIKNICAELDYLHVILKQRGTTLNQISHASFGNEISGIGQQVYDRAKLIKTVLGIEG